MLYQHLPKNKHRHLDGIESKLRQARSNCAAGYLSAYREDDLAFILATKSESLHVEVTRELTRYHSSSAQKNKSLHIQPGAQHPHLA
jgi:hypothetical protein